MEDKMSFQNKMLDAWPKEDDVAILKSNMKDMPLASGAVIKQLYGDFCKETFKEGWIPVTDALAKQFRVWVIKGMS